MTGNSTTTNMTAPAPTSLRHVETPSAQQLVELAETFEELQTVLRCCERLVSELEGPPADLDYVVIEAVWTLSLLSYARSFTSRSAGPLVTEDDVASTHPKSNVLEWHQVLLRLRDHHVADSNPRETFSVGVAQNADGSAGAVGITSAQRALVDVLTVRQMGAIAYSLCRLVDERISAQQKIVFTEMEHATAAELGALTELDVISSADSDE